MIGGERSGFPEFTGVTGIGEYRGTAPLVLLRIWIYTRDLFTADWISWPVFFWFVGMGALVRMRRRGGIRTKVHPTEAELSTGLRRQTAASNASVEARGDDLPVAGVGRIVLMGAFFALYSAALSVQPVWASPVTDLRYYVAALPLLLPMKGVFVEWAWRKSKFAGATALAVLLLTSAGAAPFNMTMLFTGERTLGLHLFQFVREIHRPYRDSIRVVSDYLLEHAAQDDLVFVNGFANREALTFTSGHRVLFCCVLDDDSPLPRAKAEALRASLHVERAAPRWIVIFGKPSKDFLERIEPHYAVAATLDVYYYPTQRPELNFHAFTPLTGEPGVHIMRLSAKPK